MIPKPGFVDDAAHPRLALFTLEGVGLAAVGGLLWLVGQVVDSTAASLGGIAFVVGLVTAGFGGLGYLVVSLTAPD
jgi:hypothetical protein